jgi:glutathione S-transferase
MRATVPPSSALLPDARRRVRADAAGAAQPPTAGDKPVFYTNRFCPYAQRVAIALNAKGVACERVEIDLRNKPEWYKALVPSGKVPALALPGDAAPRVESLELLRLIESAFPGPPSLLPPGDAAKAECEALFALCDSVYVRQGYTVLSSTAPPEQLAADFRAVAAPVEAKLAEHGGPFLLGKTFSQADVAFAPFTERYALAFRDIRGWPMLDAHPALAAWHAAVEAQPAFAASRVPEAELLALYRMFLGADYFNKAGVTAPKTPGDAGATSRRSLAALPLLFLPLRGCSTPGSTDTRVPPGDPCTPLWQPAGAAEARAVQRLRGATDADQADAPAKTD